MKKTSLISILLFTIATYGQTNLYENPKFDEIAATHKTIAIIPFSTSIELRPKDMKEISASDLEKMENDEGYSIQSAMYSWFLKRKKRGTLKIDVQDVLVTNAKLSKKDISLTNLIDYTPKEIADILGVDAVIMGDFKTNKPMSEGASIALGMVFGFWGSTNSAVINLKIYNSLDGVLLINYHKKVSGSIGSSPDDLINRVMRKASRRIAYTKN